MQGYQALCALSKRDRYAASEAAVELLSQASVLRPLALLAPAQSSACHRTIYCNLLAAGGSEIKFLATLAFSLQSESFAHRYAAR